MKKRQFMIHLMYYILGFFTVGFGVNLMDKSKIGLGAWDTVTFNIHAFCINNLGFNEEVFLIGYVSAFVALIIMVAILIYRKEVKYFILLIPVFAMANVINFWYYLIFENIELSTFMYRLVFFVVGVLLLPFGLSLIVKSTFPAFVFDEWTFMMSEILHIKSFATTRLIIEITGVTIGAIFGYFAYFKEFGHFGSVSIGTIIVAFLFGPLMQFYLKLLKVEKV